MGGTYNGSIHGGNEFNGDSGTDAIYNYDANIKPRAISNILTASNGGQNTVVSADGKRLLFVGSGAGVGYVDAGSKTSGGGKPAKAGSPTTGPGKASVGYSPAGPSRRGAGGSGTTGPGLGVVTNFVPNATKLIPPPMGPAGGAVTAGPVAGAGAAGWSVTSGWGSASSSGAKWDVKTDLELTPIRIGGIVVEPDPGFSDGGDMEQRWGEMGGSIGGLLTMGADIFGTISKGMPPTIYDVMRERRGADGW